MKSLSSPFKMMQEFKINFFTNIYLVSWLSIVHASVLESHFMTYPRVHMFFFYNQHWGLSDIYKYVCKVWVEGVGVCFLSVCPVFFHIPARGSPWSTCSGTCLDLPTAVLLLFLHAQDTGQRPVDPKWRPVSYPCPASLSCSCEIPAEVVGMATAIRDYVMPREDSVYIEDGS